MWPKNHRFEVWATNLGPYLFLPGLVEPDKGLWWAVVVLQAMNHARSMLQLDVPGP